jgi:hypothetical protein
MDTMLAAATLRDEAAKGGKALETVQSLTDEVGPRLAGSKGEPLAQEWAVRAMTAAGLTNVRKEAATVPVWQRGEETAELLAENPVELAVTALGGSVATPAAGLEADVVVVPTLDALEALPREKVEGKIVLVAQVMERSRDGRGYGKAVRARGLAASKAAKLGAIAALVRSIGTDDNRLPHTGAMRYEDGAPKIPAGALSIPDADLLVRLVSEGKTPRLRLVLTPQALADAPSFNVVGEVVGSERPDEIVLLGAHLDSWDLGRGAIDDGAGCAIVLEAGRNAAHARERPRRTVRVVLFANEENGSGGSKAYAKTHEAEMPKHVFALEADLGAGKVFTVRFRGDDASIAASKDLVSLLAPLAITSELEPGEGGSDIRPLRSFGVPVADAEQDATRYFDFHHTANDTLDKIDRAEIDQAAAAVTTLAYAAAHTRASFGRVPEKKHD